MSKDYKASEWISSYGPASLEDIRNVEKCLSVAFPKEYIDIVTHHDAAACANDSYVCFFNRSTQMKDEMSLGLFLSLSHSTSSISFSEANGVMQEKQEPHLPARVVAFSIDGRGDYLCLDYRHDSKPLICAFHTRAPHPSEEETSPIANSFEDLLSMRVT